MRNTHGRMLWLAEDYRALVRGELLGKVLSMDPLRGSFEAENGLYLTKPSSLRPWYT